MCWPTETSELAQIAPLAATAGSPMPGKVESPQQYRPLMGVAGPARLGREGGEEAQGQQGLAARGCSCRQYIQAVQAMDESEGAALCGKTQCGGSAAVLSSSSSNMSLAL